MLLNFFSQLQAYHSVQSTRLWLSGILKILFVRQWTVSDSLFNILNTESQIVNSVFLVSKSWVVACNIHVGQRLERFYLCMFLRLLQHVFYSVTATQIYPYSFFFLIDELNYFIYRASNIFQCYTDSKALILLFISGLHWHILDQ